MATNTYIAEYQKNKNNYQNIKTFLIGGAKPNFLLVLAPPYNNVTRLDINSDSMMKSYFIKAGQEEELYHLGNRGQWYVVIGNKYRNGSYISRKIANLVKNNSESTLIKNNFRILTPDDIIAIDPEYIFEDPWYDPMRLTFGGPRFDIIKELNNCSEDIDVFLSYFSSGLATKKYGDIIYPFDWLRNKDNRTSIIVGVVGSDLIRERFDKRYFKFPQNITNVMWYQPGTADYTPWYAILKIKYKKEYLYGFFYAQCCYTGFDVCGDIRLYLSKDLNHLLEYGVNANIYNKIKRYIIKKLSIKQK